MSERQSQWGVFRVDDSGSLTRVGDLETGGKHQSTKALKEWMEDKGAIGETYQGLRVLTAQYLLEEKCKPVPVPKSDS